MITYEPILFISDKELELNVSINAIFSYAVSLRSVMLILKASILLGIRLRLRYYFAPVVPALLVCLGTFMPRNVHKLCCA